MSGANLDFILDIAYSYSLKIFGSIAILLMGKWFGDRVVKLIIHILRKSKLDLTLSRFIENLLKTLLFVFIIVAAIANLGVDTSMFVAAFGAVALAVGMAFKDTFSNVGAGILIILFRPFKINHTVEISGIVGVVSDINMFSTILKTPDNKAVIIPNGQVVGENIINYSKEKTRRVELVFSIDYNDDLKLAKDLILQIAERNDKILSDPAPFVGVGSLGDNSVNLTARFWCDSADFSVVSFEMLEAVKLAFDENDISIPFPQLSIHYPRKKDDE